MLIFVFLYLLKINFFFFFQFKKYLKDPNIRELLVIGGVNVKEQISVLNSGVDIVVGTPGRLEDLIGGGYLFLNHCRRAIYIYENDE